MPKILVIDDNADNLTAAGALLKALIPNCVVITVCSGAEGIAQAQAEAPDTILLDIHMPEMNGFEVCTRLKTDERTRHIPVIMLTAIHTDSENRVKALNLGADAFLTKPINPEELTAQVKVMLRIKRAEDSLRTEKDDLEKLVHARTSALHHKTFKLNKRVKELHCLYGIGNLVEEPGMTLEQILQGTVELIPPAWQDPDMICARILSGGQEFTTKNFRATDCKLTAPIMVHDKPGGVVEICCLQEVPESAGSSGSTGPFLPEEQNLLHAIAARLGRMLERQQAEETLRQNEGKFREEKEFSNAIIDTNHTIIVGLDKQHVIRIFSKGAERITGYSRAEVLGKDWNALFLSFEDQEYLDTAWKSAWEQDYNTFMHSLKSRDTHDILWDAVQESNIYSVTGPLQIRDGTLKTILWQNTRICTSDDERQHLHISIGVDITERQQAEEALRENEERMRIALEGTDQGLWDWDIVSGKIHFDRNWPGVLGYTPNETDFDFTWWKGNIHPESTPIFENALTAYLEGREHYYELEYRFRDKAGEWRWIWARGICIAYDPQGQPLRMIGTHRDITDRKQAEQRQHLVGHILDILNRTYTKTDSIREILLLIKRFTGFEAVGIHLKEGDDLPYYVTSGFPEKFVNAERVLCIRDLDGKMPRDGQGNPYLECMCGNVLCRRTNPALPFFSEQGSFWSNCTSDLLASTTEADRQARTRNRCNGEGYESVALIPLRSGDEVIGLIQLNDHRKNRFTLEFIEFFETIGASIGIALAHKNTQDALAAERASLASRVAERTAELSQANELLQQAKDTAEAAQRAAEAAQRDAEAAQRDAEEANRAKSEFLATMSHELRTPLNAILGFAQVLKADNTLTPHHKERLTTIQSGGEHLLTLITDILDISRIEARRMELQPQELHFPAFLRTIDNIIRMQAEQKGITFLCEFGPNLPDGIRADEKRLRQILLNLLNNAVKFTEHGTVTLEVNSEKLQVTNKDVPPAHHSSFITIHFSINDTGIGIAPDQLERIFLPFQQIRDKASYAEGTGLGLAISRQLVEIMGAELRVQSTVGKGSRFWFELSLPVVKNVAASVSKPSRRITGYTGERRIVLVVDDSAKNRDVLMGMLLPLGFRIAEAQNGRECVEKVVKYMPDIVLMDLHMPVLDGFGATRKIRELEAAHVRPEVPCTGVGFSESMSPEATDAPPERGKGWGAESDATTELFTHPYPSQEGNPGSLPVSKDKKSTHESPPLSLPGGEFGSRSGSDAKKPYLSAEAPGSRIPIIAITASVFEETRTHAIAAGFTDFLMKPFQRKDLLELLHAHAHLEWVYADDPEETPDAASAPLNDLLSKVLPPDAARNLLQCAQLGNPKAILAILSTLEHQDAACIPAVKTLRAFTKKYQFERIVDLLHYASN